MAAEEHRRGGVVQVGLDRGGAEEGLAEAVTPSSVCSWTRSTLGWTAGRSVSSATILKHPSGVGLVQPMPALR
jgi:hypothetical protein